MKENFKICCRLLEEFEQVVGIRRSRKLYEAIMSALNESVSEDLIRHSFSVAVDKDVKSASYVAAIIDNYIKQGKKSVDDVSARKKSIAERQFIDQREPSGKIEEWEKEWLREIGFLK